MTETTNTTDVQQRRDALMQRSREAHTQLEELLATFSDEEQTRPGVTSDWSVKDHLAHLTWWEQRVIRMLAGAPDPIEAIPGENKSEDDINAYVYAQNHARSLADVRAAFDASYQEMLQLIATAPDDVFTKYHD
ncbi:MAG TPA: maleylpyruvate isomerase N-terminal domain-containing protein, partial [Ktedonobacterales bacterium]|nr:maleylpyruvate isomerase N-terminal domain-containing protein [Ktedonobacterales bacterium]